MTSTFLVIVIIVTYISSPTNAARQQSECLDAYQCQNKKLTTNINDCLAFESCAESSIKSKGKMGYIDCTGSHSCNEAKALTAFKYTHCLGHYSCFGCTEMSAKIIQCAGSYSCTSCESIVADSLMYCGGLYSCKKATVSANSKIYCNGLSSCNGATMTSGDEIICEGSKSCLSAKMKATKKVTCTGALACKRARITAEKVILSGSQSGDGAKINSEDIIATGYEALTESEMDSQNKTRMKVTTSKEAAGKDATVICQAGSDCEVECTDSCDSMEVVSMSGSTTNVTVAGEVCVEGVEMPGCPTVKVSTSDCEDRELQTYLAHKREIIALRQKDKYIIDTDDDDEYKAFIDRTPHHDAMEVIEPEIKKCHESKACNKESISDDDAQCYGYEGCLQSVITQSVTTAIISCFGASGCNGASLNTRGDILCNGESSCYGTPVFEGRAAQCGGYLGCATSTGVVTVGSIDCEATASCEEDTILATKIVKCVANRACYGSTITTGNTILCEGHKSCSDSTLETTAIIKCTATSSCHGSTLTADKYVYADGNLAAAGSVIDAPSIRAYGDRAIALSNIDTVNREQIMIKAYGEMSSNGATVKCQRDAVCKILCESTGCKGMELYCFDGSDCKITPKECGRERGPKQIEGIYCPTIKTSLSKDDDDKLIKYIQRRKREIKKEEFYMEIMNEINGDSHNEMGHIEHIQHLNGVNMEFADNMNNDNVRHNDDNADDWNVKLVSISWNMVIIGMMILISIGLICYFKCDYLKFRGEDISYYQHLK